MADTKISALTDGGTVQTTDQIPVNRAGANKRVVVGTLATLDTITSASVTDFTEATQDVIGALLADSSTIDYTYNDAGNAMTVAVITQMSVASDASGLKLSGDSAAPGNLKYYGTDSGGTKGWYSLTSASLTDFTEATQDVIGALLVDSSTIDYTYNDAGNALTTAVITQMSVTSDASGVKLSGDSATPGNLKYYGTDSGGTKGYNSLGGLAVLSTAAITDGQIPIGTSSGHSVSLATLTAGSNITITNAAGSITIAANAASGITIGSSGITSGTNGKLLYDNSGVVGEATVGSGLSLSAGTLSATGGGSSNVIFADAPNQDFDLTNGGSGGDVTIISKSITGISAGDQVVLEVSFGYDNRSGAARTYSPKITLGSLTINATVSTEPGTVSNGSSKALRTWRAVFAVSATNLAYSVWSSMSGINTIASGQLASSVLNQTPAAWNTTSSDLTGTQTLSLTVASNATTATQTGTLYAYQITKQSTL